MTDPIRGPKPVNAGRAETLHDPRQPAATAVPAASSGWAARPTGSRPAVVGMTASSSLVSGITLRDYSGNPRAITEAASVLSQVASRADIALRLEKKHVTLSIIPANKMMTDLPEFAQLRGKTTFDGRHWEDVRGSGGTTGHGHITVGVPEEGLADMPGNTYRDGYSVAMHELAHVVLSVGLTRDEKRAVTDAYQARKTAGGPWTEAYGSSNEQEYFAQGTNAWFGRNGSVGQNGAAWVKANDPALAKILEATYGATT